MILFISLAFEPNLRDKWFMPLYLGDALIAIAFILLPGIRGYDDWQIHEYLLLAAMFLYIVYLRHKKK